MIVATHRIFTGRAVARGYLLDSITGKIIWSCPHFHKSLIHLGGKNAGTFAQRCAEKELRKRT